VVYLNVLPHAIVLAIVGIDVDLPVIGPLTISLTYIDIPYIGSFKLQLHSLEGSLTETLFLSLNWHLLWYLAACLFLVILLRRAPLPHMTLDCYCALLALFFLLFTFHMTYLYAYAIDFSTVNRAFMYPVPILLFATFRVLTQFLCNPGKPKMPLNA